MMAADFLDAAVDFLPEETPEPIRFDGSTVTLEISDVQDPPCDWPFPPIVDFLPEQTPGPIQFDGSTVGLENSDFPDIGCYPIPLPSVGDCEPRLPEDWWDPGETEVTNTLGDEIEPSDNDSAFEPDFPWGDRAEIIWENIQIDPEWLAGRDFGGVIDLGEIELTDDGRGNWTIYVPGVGIFPISFICIYRVPVIRPSDWVGGSSEPGESSDFPGFDLVDEVPIDEVLAAERVQEPITRNSRSFAFAEMSTMAAAATAAHLQGNATDSTPPGSGRRRR